MGDSTESGEAVLVREAVLAMQMNTRSSEKRIETRGHMKMVTSGSHGVIGIVGDTQSKPKLYGISDSSLIDTELVDIGAWIGMDREVKEENVKVRARLNSQTKRDIMADRVSNSKDDSLKGKGISVEDSTKAIKLTIQIDSKRLG